jgi:sec-independent protein translocase protein TatB
VVWIFVVEWKYLVIQVERFEMQFYFLIFEGLGTTELLLILVVALIIFGPKKLPQLARSFGKSVAEFKRASEEFKQQWEKEVDMAEFEEKKNKTELSLVEAEDQYNQNTISRPTPFAALTGETQEEIAPSDLTTNEITSPEIKEFEPATISTAIQSETPAERKTSKRDWL